MNDMSSVIVPKSDQINADSLLAGPQTITITEVDIRPGTEQPVSIWFEGDGGKPWKPCKSMCRVLVNAWGPDAKAYVGRSATLYCDPDVTWGGMKVGGIRISHMSHIEREMVLALTATKGKKAVTRIKPLQAGTTTDDPAQRFANGYMNKLEGIQSSDELEEYAHTKAPDIERLAEKRPELAKQCDVMLEKRRNELSESGPARTDADHGDQHDGTDEDELAARAREHSNAQAAGATGEY